jgi:hypothetical protein
MFCISSGMKETTTCEYLPLVRTVQRTRGRLKEKWKICSYGNQGLIVLDFSFCGYIKNTVYAEKVIDMQHLKDRICADIETITSEMLTHVWEVGEYTLRYFYGDKRCPY